MKVFGKRVIAFLLDSIIFGFYFASFQKVLPDWYFNFGAISYLVLFIPIFIKDLAFRNASIGKKIMRLSIFDDNWQKPSIFTLIKRSFLTMSIGYLLCWKQKLTGGSLIVLFDWEERYLKTRVIDKKVYKQLSEYANSKNGVYSNTMTELYDEYLNAHYNK